MERQSPAWDHLPLGYNHRALPSDDIRRSPRHAPPGIRQTGALRAAATKAVPLAAPRHSPAAVRPSAREVLHLQSREMPIAARQSPTPELSLDGRYHIVSKIAMPTNPAAMNAGVHTVRDPLNGILRVQKLVRIDQPSRLKALNQELSALYTARDHNGPDSINRIISHFHDPARRLVSITLEYCTKGSLADLIRHRKAASLTLPTCALFTVAWSLARALSFLHYGIRDFCAPLPPREELLAWNGILHLDIKPENVFLKPNPGSRLAPYRIVLGDFGCSVTRRDIATGVVDPHVQSHGTEGWFPPENTHSLLYEPTMQAPFGYYGRRTDVWQVGGVVQCLALLQRFPIQEYVDNGFPLGPVRRHGEEAEAMVTGCMARNLGLRFSAPQLGYFLIEQARLAGITLEA